MGQHWTTGKARRHLVWALALVGLLGAAGARAMPEVAEPMSAPLSVEWLRGWCRALPAEPTTGEVRPPEHLFGVPVERPRCPQPVPVDDQALDDGSAFGPPAPEVMVAEEAAQVEPADAPPAASVRVADRAIVAPKPITDLVEQMAPGFQLLPQLVLAIMKAESNFDPAALSSKHAMGLMQLIPQTAERFNVKNPYDAKQNIRGGMAYLRWLLARFEGDVALVAAAYNAGERTVERYLGIPPYGETRAYVRRVVDAFGEGAHPYDASVVEPSSRLGRIRAPKPAR